MKLFFRSLKMMFNDLNTAGKIAVGIAALLLLIWIL